MTCVLKIKSQTSKFCACLHLPVGDRVLVWLPRGLWAPILPLAACVILVKACHHSSWSSSVNWRGWMAWSLRIFSKVAHEKTITTCPEDPSKVPLISPSKKYKMTFNLNFTLLEQILSRLFVLFLKCDSGSESTDRGGDLFLLVRFTNPSFRLYRTIGRSV